MKKHFTAKEKGTIAIEAIKEIDPLAKIASKHQANPIQVGLWKKKALSDIHQLNARKHYTTHVRFGKFIHRSCLDKPDHLIVYRLEG
jgi:hypothetical protein